MLEDFTRISKTIHGIEKWIVVVRVVASPGTPVTRRQCGQQPQSN